MDVTKLIHTRLGQTLIQGLVSLREEGNLNTDIDRRMPSEGRETQKERRVKVRQRME